MKFLSSINANDFTTLAFVIGFLLCENLSVAEQNAIGNWLMLVGQVLETNASQQQVINNANNASNANSEIVGDERGNNMDSLKKSINIINEKLSNL